MVVVAFVNIFVNDSLPSWMFLTNTAKSHTLFRKIIFEGFDDLLVFGLRTLRCTVPNTNISYDRYLSCQA